MGAECDRFGRYLIGARPGAYVREWYERGISQAPERFAPGSRLDRVLLAMSGWSWVPLRSVDMTARLMAPGGAVRRKLIFLTALLESAPATWERYETPSVRSRAAFFLGLIGRGLVSGLALLWGLVVLLSACATGAGRSAA